MTDDASLEALLRRPVIVAAVGELGLETLGAEDVLAALRRFGAVRIDVGDDPARPFTCVLDVPGQPPERAAGRTILHAALSCWAETLVSASRYADSGLGELARFLARADDAV
jgi:hypothetical protein